MVSLLWQDAWHIDNKSLQEWIAVAMVSTTFSWGQNVLMIFLKLCIW